MLFVPGPFSGGQCPEGTLELQLPVPSAEADLFKLLY